VNNDFNYHGLFDYVRVRWPTYLGLALSALGTLFLIVTGVDQNRWALVATGLAILILLAYFTTTSLWAAYEQFVRRQTSPAQILVEMGQIQPTSDFVHVGLGARDLPIQLSRRLTRGHIRAIDVYNPQLTPSSVLARQRRPLPPLSDPRLTWLEGSVDLLPLPDNSVDLVVAGFTIVEFWQRGDRERLLREIRRVLRPGGRLLLAEPARTTTQLLMVGPAALRLPSPDEWRNLLRTAGLTVTREKDVGGYYMCFRAEKPQPGFVQQLALDLGI
jgi:SAM-dependent methyltransferase